tara:strand:+ start:2414 stop:2707 length:294 start_codon:yes stop_codon:yes gene_type:complete
MPIWGAKTIVLEHEAAAKADEACKEHHRFEEAFDGLQWLLARTQDVGLSRVGSPNDERVYVQAGNPIAKTPSIWVLFSDGDDEVRIWDINVVAYAED